MQVIAPDARLKVVGLDLSLTSTGVAWSHGPVDTLATDLKGVKRLIWVRDAICGLLETLEPDLVVIEGYSFGSKFSRGHDAGELGGVVKVEIAEMGIPIVIVAPKTRIKYATGNGNGTKEAVLAAAIRRLDYEGSSTDEADALWLRAMALDHYGEPLVEMPKVHRDALVKVEWPELAVAA